MKIDGGCHCGHLAFEAEVDPERVSICHCADCQMLGGSAFRMGVPAEDGTFRMISGEPKFYIKTTAESGVKRAHAFCAECGANIYTTTTDEGPKAYRLCFGAIRQRNELPPKLQIWTRSAHDWVNDIGKIRSLEKQ